MVAARLMAAVARVRRAPMAAAKLDRGSICTVLAGWLVRGGPPVLTPPRVRSTTVTICALL
jgi:hypothetical protein